MAPDIDRRYKGLNQGSTQPAICRRPALYTDFPTGIFQSRRYNRTAGNRNRRNVCTLLYYHYPRDYPRAGQSENRRRIYYSGQRRGSARSCMQSAIMTLLLLFSCSSFWKRPRANRRVALQRKAYNSKFIYCQPEADGRRKTRHGPHAWISPDGVAFMEFEALA